MNGVPMSGVKAISAGGSHSLFLKTDGTVWGCGANEQGELGDGATVSLRATPVLIFSTATFSAISGANRVAMVELDASLV